MNQTAHQGPARDHASAPDSPGDPAVIADNIDNVVAAVNADTLLGIWAVSRLAAKLGVSVALSCSTEPVQIVRELGDEWADVVVQTVRENPDRAHHVLRAATGAFETIRNGAPRAGCRSQRRSATEVSRATSRPEVGLACRLSW
jgi:hypothetical protein